MTPEDRELLRSLIAGERLLSLSLVVEGEPVAGLLPFVAAADFGAVYVQSSRLARHGRGLVSGARFGAVVHRPDRPEADPLQIPRVVFEGSVDSLAAGRPELEGAVRLFVSRFPGAAMTLTLPDFALHRLVIERGRLVAGFGRAINLTAAHFEDLAGE